MKNFSLKTKRNSPHSSVKRAVLKVAFLILIAILIVFALRGPFGMLFSYITHRIEGVSSYFQTSEDSLPSYIRDRKEMNEEINHLKQELAALSGSDATILRLTHENDELRLLMGDQAEDRIVVGVIARPPMVPYDLLVLDEGSDKGIIVGAPVYVDGNHVIGLVSRVFSDSSLVTLISSAGTETSVYVYGPNVFAYAYGEGGGVVRISVPQGVLIKEGDPVVLPSLHEGDLGIIDEVVSRVAEPEQNAYVTLPVSLQSIRLVSVGKSVVDPKTYKDAIPEIELIKDRFRIEVPDAARSGTATTSSSTPMTATST